MSAKRKAELRSKQIAAANSKRICGDHSNITANLVDGDGNVLQTGLVLSPDTSVRDLTDIRNKELEGDVPQMFSFYINDIEVLDKIADALTNETDFDKDVDIVCEPEVSFKVFSVTRCSSSIPGHAGTILDVRCSPDGRYLASASADTTVRLWDVSTETPKFVCKEHKNWVLVVSFSPCGRKLASACVNGMVCIWDPVTGNRKGRPMTGHSKWITGIAWKPLHLDGSCRILASASKDSTIRIWDSVMNRCLMVLSSHLQSVTSIKWSGSDLLYSSSQDRTIKVWEPSKGTLERTLEGHGHWVNHLALSTDFVMRTGWFDPSDAAVVYKDHSHSDEELQQLALKRYNGVIHVVPEVMVSSSDDFTMSMWRLSTDRKPIAKLVGHQQPINEAAFSPNGKLLASASFDKSIKIWSSKTGAYLKTLRGHVQAVYKVCWSADSRQICSCGADSTVKIWDFTGKLLYDLPGHSDQVQALDWSPDGQRVVSGGIDKVLKIWRR